MKFKIKLFLFVLVIISWIGCKKSDGGDSSDLLALLGILGTTTTTVPACQDSASSSRTWNVISGATGRSQASKAILTNGKVLAIGGEGNLGNGILNQVQSFDFNTSQWTTINPLNVDREYHSSISLNNGKALVFGGTDINLISLSSVELYDPANGNWSFAAPMGHARALHAPVLLADGRVLVSGGEENFNATFGAEIYDPTQNTWSDTLPMTIARWATTATALQNGKVLVAGGNNNNSVSINTAELYNSNDNSWTLLPPMRESRHSHSAILLNDGRLLVAGGEFSIANRSAYRDSMEIYDPRTNQWTFKKMSVPRSEFTMELLNDGSVLFLGGRNEGFVSSNLRYFPSTDSWCEIPRLKALRHGHYSATLRNGSIFVFGGMSATGYENSSEILKW
ncbi:kelch repeat protein [Leptospira weilii str. 2006001853]|uniref:Kelch repeat protein n=2 Tax=Leptospira weilii TaxID=28184 RepID=A0A828YVL9_9LEPT|nr:kelch repeat-containing protein [Leptospira weilii]EMM71699.1 kelch repeat protein [Leptospira weilii str. 2006001855]EKR62518.1 kelch repeat protein [Leptospira weilii str. 2006001853]MCL8266744.1 galactose oxidase [Leptospira weilii]OMI16370.1 galactose oxidase [Leptospira weilii serovar Heyan]QDK24920.1 galactose oxidase [Leptospira weilii]